MCIYLLFPVNNFFFGGRGIIRSPDSITIISISLLHRSRVPASVGKARVMLVTSQLLHPPQQLNNNETETTIAATTTPKGDCKTNLSESDL